MTGSAQTSPSAGTPATPASAIALLFARGLFQLAAVVIVGIWAFTAWPLPFPGILIGIGMLALTVVVWALFLSPKPVLRTDRFGQALVELLLLAAAVGALLGFGLFWVWPVLFGLVGAVIGYLASASR